MSSITLHVEPTTKPMKWKDFVKRTPHRSIAIDGYVNDVTKFNYETKHSNFDHHTGVNRSATRATCSQILLAIRRKFFDYYKDEHGEVNFHVYANDCDEDVCLSYYLLKHGYRSKNVIDPSLNRLVSMVDMLDTTAGAYPFPSDLPVLKELAWIFQPYRVARTNGLLATKNPDIYKAIIVDVESRITAHLCGKGESLSLDTSYKEMYRSPAWVMVDEIGGHARTGMFSDGITSFVSVRTRPNGQHDYVLGKMSEFVPHFPIEKFYAALNAVEGLKDDLWGGSDTIGGSPRVAGSKIKPEELIDIINGVIKEGESK